MATTRYIDIKVRTGDSKSEVKDLEAEMAVLAKKTDQADLAVKSFEKDQKKLGNTVSKNGTVFNSSGQAIDELSLKYKKLKDSANKANTELNTKLKASAKGVSEGLGSVGRSAGQAGIQIQQFVGQIQGGQSAMLALSAQSADLGFVLGAPLIGAIVGIGASVIGMASAFGEVNTTMVETSDIITSLVDKFDTLSSSQQKLTQNLIANEIKRTSASLQKLKDDALGVGVGFDGLLSSEESITAEQDKYRSSIISTELALAKLKKQLNEVKNGSFEYNAVNVKQQEQIGALLSGLVNTANNYGKTSRELAIYKAELLGANDIQKQAINLAFDRIDALKQEAQAQKDLAKSSEYVDKLTNETQQLQIQLGLRQAANDGYITQQEAALSTQFINKQLRDQAQFEAELERLGNDEAAKTELRLQFKENRLVEEELFNQQLLGLEQSASESSVKNLEKEQELKRLVRNNDISNAQTAASAGISLLKAFGSKSLKAQKVFAIADSVVNIAAGVAKALNNPFPANIGFAAQVAAQGAGLIATIKGTDAGSSSTPSVSSTATTSTTATAATSTAATQQSQTKVIDIRLDDDALLTGSAVKKLMSDAISSDDDVVIQITESQQELKRVGG